MASEPNVPERRSRSSEGGRRKWWWALGPFLAYWLWRRWRGSREAAGQEEGGVPEHVLQQGHEPDETNVRLIVGFGFGLLVGLVVLLWLLGGFFGLMERRAEPRGEQPFADYQPVPPEPRLQADPAVDLQLLHEREYERLHRYAWADEQEGIVRIPIERAMELIAERGLPTRDTAAVGDTVLVPTESGFLRVWRGPPRQPPETQPFLGSSPEPYTPFPDFRRFLTEEGYLPRTDTSE